MKNNLLCKRQLAGHTEVDRKGLYKCSTLEKFKLLCGKAAGIRHRTKHNLGDDWGVSLKDMKVPESFAYPELCSTFQQ